MKTFTQYMEFRELNRPGSRPSRKLSSLVQYAVSRYPSTIVATLRDLGRRDSEIETRLREIDEDGLSMLKNSDKHYLPPGNSEPKNGEVIVPSSPDAPGGEV